MADNRQPLHQAGIPLPPIRRSGFWMFLNFIKQTLFSIPIFFVCSVVAIDWYAVAIEYGAYSFSKKPISTAFLVLIFTIVCILLLTSYFRCVFTSSAVCDNPPPIGYYDTVEQNPRTCRKCNSLKPARAHHCSICGQCILKMDHHCPWVATCVGFRNYKFFLLFIFWAVMGAIMYFIAVGTVFFSMLGNDASTAPSSATNPVHRSGSLNLFASANDITLSSVSNSNINSSHYNTKSTQSVPYIVDPVSLHTSNVWNTATDVYNKVYKKIYKIQGLNATAVPTPVPSTTGPKSTIDPIANLTSRSHMPNAGKSLLIVLTTIITAAFGFTLICFLAFHIHLVINGKTTIEVNFHPGQSRYDVGWKQNVCAVMGDNPWLWLLPVDTNKATGYEFEGNGDIDVELERNDISQEDSHSQRSLLPVSTV